MESSRKFQGQFDRKDSWVGMLKYKEKVNRGSENNEENPMMWLFFNKIKIYSSPSVGRDGYHLTVCSIWNW